MKPWCILTSALTGLLLSVPALAQRGGGQPNKRPPDHGSSDHTPPRPGVEPPHEEADTTYRFGGARFRYIVVPQFYMALFGSGGTTVGVPALGPEYTIRKNGFDYVLSAMYASYAMGPTPFKGKSDGDDAWEIVDSHIKAVYLMSDFLWSRELTPQYAIFYGGGVGLAAVFGEVHRMQAYPGPAGPGDADGYRPCIAPGNPNAAFCGSDNDHYGSYSEPSWANGGSKPIVFPWLSVQTGLRFKPFREFMMRVEVGWNLLNGPFFGLSGSYGL